MKPLLLAALVVLMPTAAYARTYETHFGTPRPDGFDLKVMTTLSGAVCALAGDSGSVYLGDNFYIGGGGYGGSSSTGNVIGYGGLIVGSDSSMLGPLGLDAHLLVGGGGGRLRFVNGESIYGGGVVFEPSMGVCLKFSKAFKLSLSASVLCFPGAPDLSGPMVTLSFH